MNDEMQISEILSLIFNEVSGAIYGTHGKAHFLDLMEIGIYYGSIWLKIRIA
jgi:hypothetical protein